jgi:hypothetical protein
MALRSGLLLTFTLRGCLEPSELGLSQATTFQIAPTEPPGSAKSAMLEETREWGKLQAPIVREALQPYPCREWNYLAAGSSRLALPTFPSSENYTTLATPSSKGRSLPMVVGSTA